MHIDIEYRGHSCFLISADDGSSLLTDPFQKIFSYPAIDQLTPDIVTISHSHQGHNNFSEFINKPSVIMGSGERKIGWITIKGISSFHDQYGGDKYGVNTIFYWKMRSFSFCHLGDLGDLPSQDIYNQIDTVDFLFIPVGGKNVLSPQQADEVTKKIKPRFVIPMHFKTSQYDTEFEQTDFLNLQANTIISPMVNKIRFRREEILSTKDTCAIKLNIKAEEK